MQVTPSSIRELYVSAIVRETFNTKSFQLTSSGGQITYFAGQFLTFVFNDITGVEIRRSYSISSSPVLPDPLTITVKRIENGEISRQLNDRTKEGDVLRTIGAAGFFTLPEKPEEDCVFVFFAAGSGIAPVISQIRTLLHASTVNKIILVYSNHHRASTIFYFQLVKLQEQFSSRFIINFLFSNSFYVSHGRLTPESLEEILIAYHINHLRPVLFYLCGPAGYMRMIQFKLLTLGFSASAIRKEIFHVDKPLYVPKPPDTSAHMVSVQSASGTYQFPVQFPDTILRAAQKRKIAIPFSCETGQCGTCAATCVEGKIWMSTNEVLLEEDLAKGKVLTCTGYPVFGDVTLHL